MITARKFRTGSTGAVPSSAAVVDVSTYLSVGNNTVHAIPLPSYSIGDTLVLLVGSRNYAVTTPAGWTLAESSNEIKAFYRVADGGEGSSVNVTIASTGALSGGCVSVSGATYTQSDNSTSTTPVSLANATNAALIFFAVTSQNTASSTPPSRFAEHMDGESLSTFASASTLCVDDKAGSTDGTSVINTWTLAGTVGNLLIEVS